MAQNRNGRPLRGLHPRAAAATAARAYKQLLEAAGANQFPLRMVDSLVNLPVLRFSVFVSTNDSTIWLREKL